MESVFQLRWVYFDKEIDDKYELSDDELREFLEFIFNYDVNHNPRGLTDQQLETLSKIKQNILLYERLLQAVKPIVENSIPLVMKLANNFITRTNFKVGNEFQDFVNEGIIGLHRGAILYDSRKGYKFSTFVSKHILNAFQSYLNRIAFLKVGSRNNAKLHQVVSAMNNTQQIRDPNKRIKEISRQTGFSYEFIREIQSFTHPVLSLDTAFHNDDTTIMDRLIAGDISPEESIVLTDIRSKLLQIIEGGINARKTGRRDNHKLDTRDIEIFLLYFGFIEHNTDLTLNEIGEKYGLSRERVRQIIQLILTRLKKLMA